MRDLQNNGRTGPDAGQSSKTPGDVYKRQALGRTDGCLYLKLVGTIVFYSLRRDICQVSLEVEVADLYVLAHQRTVVFAEFLGLASAQHHILRCV